MIHDLEPIAFITARQFPVHLAASRAEIAFHLDRKLGIAAVAHQFIDQLFTLVGGNQVQRFFAHRARQFIVQHRVDFLLHVVGDVCPRERVHGAVGRVRIFFEAFFEQPYDGALGAADRAVKQDDAPLRAVIARGGFEDIDQVIQALIDPINRVPAVVRFVAEEAVACDLLLVFDILLHSI